MIIEIAPFDLVDGNRYIPADVVGRMYRDAVECEITKQLTPEARAGTANNEAHEITSIDGDIPSEMVQRLYKMARVDQPAPLIDVSVVLRDPMGQPFDDHRAIVSVRAGRSPTVGFTAASIGLARALFMVKDAAVEIIDLVDPPFEQWFPLPKETAA